MARGWSAGRDAAHVERWVFWSESESGAVDTRLTYAENFSWVLRRCSCTCACACAMPCLHPAMSQARSAERRGRRNDQTTKRGAGGSWKCLRPRPWALGPDLAH